MPSDRPSKKQYELLSYIEGFIKAAGYGPSYREIMRALDYKSVSTVAIHVDGLIKRGLLRKTDHSARSLELVPKEEMAKAKVSGSVHITWLKSEIKKREMNENLAEAKILVDALKVLMIKKDIDL